MKSRVVIAAAILVAPLVHGADPSLPAGWRFPVPSDYFSPESVAGSPNPLRVDLNSDGVLDSAFHLVHNEKRHGAVFVQLGGNGKLVRINASPQGVADYILVPISSGCYATALGQVRVESTAVALVEVEYGTGTMYWSHNGSWQGASLYQGGTQPLSQCA